MPNQSNRTHLVVLQGDGLIERVLDHTIANPQWRTPDLGGPLGTKAFGESVAASLADLAK